MLAPSRRLLATFLSTATLLLFAVPAHAVFYEIGLKVMNANRAPVVIPIYVYDRNTGALVASARSNRTFTNDTVNVQIELDGETPADTVGRMNLAYSSSYTVVFGNNFGSAYLTTGAHNLTNNDDWFRIRPQPNAIIHASGADIHHFSGWPTATYPPYVVISGPTSLTFKEKGTFTANVANGISPVTYEWRWRNNGVGAWSSIVGTAQTYQRTMANIDFELQATCRHGSDSGVDTHYVHYFNGPIDPAADALRVIGVRPNPTRGSAEFSFDLRQAGRVGVTVFDSRGRRVGSLFDGELPPGTHRFVWNAAGMPAGLYLIRARGVGFEKTVKLAVSN